jgi:hypothetical protein
VWCAGGEAPLRRFAGGRLPARGRGGLLAGGNAWPPLRSVGAETFSLLRATGSCAAGEAPLRRFAGGHLPTLGRGGPSGGRECLAAAPLRRRGDSVAPPGDRLVCRRRGPAPAVRRRTSPCAGTRRPTRWEGMPDRRSAPAAQKLCRSSGRPAGAPPERPRSGRSPPLTRFGAEDEARTGGSLKIQEWQTRRRRGRRS